MGEFDSYTLNRHRHTKPTQSRRYGIQRVNHQLECDLFSIQRFEKYNEGYKWVFACIDIFSKYGYAIPLKDKRATTVVKALDTILSELPYPPRVIFSDRGSEMTAREMTNYLKRRGIQQFISKQA